MPKRNDLLKLFDVEGKATLKTILQENENDLNYKSPRQMQVDIKNLVDMLDKFVEEGDLDNAILAINGITIRANAMNDVANDLKRILDKNQKKS